MRRNGKADANQPALVKAIRQLGASVLVLSNVGKGCPDLAIGHGGRTYLVEIKNPTLPPSARTLTPAEKEWHQAWRGQVAIVETLEDVLRVLGIQ